ncbi:hypothetical protein SAMN05216213_11633 [Ectopseudomonas guguanensis]|uniref:Uncharacterized protein n=1 Tax=Ectopseudomonas guguanensis TaxID=1198456 RepID=A0A1H0XGA5_9GAMM|nr:hypothetical protein SAMN05216213_11633 [Pseudomonas guguanensis]
MQGARMREAGHGQESDGHSQQHGTNADRCRQGGWGVADYRIARPRSPRGGHRCDPQTCAGGRAGDWLCTQPRRRLSGIQPQSVGGDLPADHRQLDLRRHRAGADRPPGCRRLSDPAGPDRLPSRAGGGAARSGAGAAPGRHRADRYRAHPGQSRAPGAGRHSAGRGLGPVRTAAGHAGRLLARGRRPGGGALSARQGLPSGVGGRHR